MKPILRLLISGWALFLAVVPYTLAQALTEADVKVDLPGLTVHTFLPLVDDSTCSPQPPHYVPVADLRCLRWPWTPVTDADGSIYFSTEDFGIGFPPNSAVMWRTRADATTERVVHVDPRQDPTGLWAVGRFDAFTIDLARGDLYILFRTTCIPSLPLQECTFASQTSVIRISGLPPLKPGRAKPSV